MSSLFQNLLIWHVLIGLGGISFFVAVLVGLMRKNINLRFLKSVSLLGFLSFVASWITGGYYYVAYYGKAVKPVIKSGEYSWVHGIIMETKEHIFLFLPFLAAIVVLGIWLVESNFQKPISVITLLIVILGVVITFMGMAISGAVR